MAREKYVNPVKQVVTDILLDKSVFSPPVRWRGGLLFNPDSSTFFAKHEYPLNGCSEIRMIWERGSSSYCGPDYNRDIKVYQSSKIETVVMQSPWFERDCKLADIILPVSTEFERNDITEPGKTGVYASPAQINLRSRFIIKSALSPLGNPEAIWRFMQ